MKKSCFNCKTLTSRKLFTFFVCDGCYHNAGLMSDITLKKHLAKDPQFRVKVQSKLDLLEKVYARRKIKLLHILESV